jgi:hypothetical protein
MDVMGARAARRVLAAATGAMLVAGCTPLRNAVNHLASDELGGRNNGTPGSVLAQDFIIDRLDDFAEGIDPSKPGADAFRQPITGGTNIVGVIPGRDLADEYVVVGAHYDGLGTGCRTSDPADTICNGATDNATGVAAVLDIGRKLAAGHGPRRSVILALWDREEDGLLGSKAYVDAPPVPLAQTVAYVNFDIQGANLLPSLRDTTFAIGAETGGERLRSAVEAATGPGPLDTTMLSWVFGQARSDYVNFINRQVPTVFFSDSTGPCYHRAQDEADIVDFTKLHHQTKAALRLTKDLANDDTAPTFVPGTPLVTYADAVALQGVSELILLEIDRFTGANRDRLLAAKARLDTIVAEGPEAFDGTDGNTVVADASSAVTILTSGTCDGFLTG